MNIGLIDVDGHNFPNLALMKISAWHKERGDTVEWWWSDFIHYDIVYMSKVFSYSEDVAAPINADTVIKGGTGYAITMDGMKEAYSKEADPQLPQEIESIYPDYSLYQEWGTDTAIGFLTRGCPRNCGFCHVAGKEGLHSRKVANLEQFWSGQKNIEIMDPNILASPDRMELLEQLKNSRAKVNFNQGLDIRLMTQEIAILLGEMRIKRLHFAWDNPQDDLEKHFLQFAEWYRRKDPAGKVVYVLTNYTSTPEEDLHRVYALRDMGYDPYVMIYNKAQAPQHTRHLQRWCNNRLIFRAVRNFEDYDPKRG